MDVRIPEVPDKPVLEETASGTVKVTWPRAVRARRYRVFVTKPGDAVTVAACTVREPEAEIKELPEGVAIEVTIKSGNKSGESRPSEPSEIVLKSPARNEPA